MSSKTELTCDGCSKKFQKYTYRIGIRNFCSHSCFSAWQKGKEKIGRRKREKLAKQKARLVTCSYCKHEFERKPSERREHTFCSKQCYINWRRKIYGWKAKGTRICKQCGKPFLATQSNIKHGWGNFCSMECKGNWQRENIFGKRHHQYSQIERTCEICGQKFFIKPSRLGYKHQGRYCSLKCMGEARRKQKIQQWQDPEYREETIKKSLKGLFKRPTTLEKQFIKLIEQYHLPYKYTGNGSFLIGFKNPDFVNINGAKICIEVANHYHHQGNWANERIAHFSKYGWECLIFFAKGEKDNKLNKEEILTKLNSNAP